MLLKERPRNTEPVVTPAGEVRLRLKSDGLTERLVSLPGGKLTVGSGPRCNLRIQRPGVAPIHCLIVHGAEGLTVRRWAANTLLNGLPFDDAPLSAGDRLSVGPVELDILADQPEDQVANKASESHPEATIAPRKNIAQPNGPNLTERSADRASSDMWQAVAAEAAFQRLRTSRALLRTRLRRLLAAMRRERGAYGELSARVEDMRRQAQAALAEKDGFRYEVETARHEMAAAQTQLSHLTALIDEKQKEIDAKEKVVENHQRLLDENARLAAEYQRFIDANAQLGEENSRLAADQQRLADAHVRLTEENARLATDYQRLADENTRLAEAKTALEQQVEQALCERQESAGSLDRLQQQYGERQTEIDQQRSGWLELQRQWEKRLNEQAQRIEELEAELDELRTASPQPAHAPQEPIEAWRPWGDQSPPPPDQQWQVHAPQDEPALVPGEWQPEAPQVEPADEPQKGQPAEPPVDVVPQPSVHSGNDSAGMAGEKFDWKTGEIAPGDETDAEDIAAASEFSLWGHHAQEERYELGAASQDVSDATDLDDVAAQPVEEQDEVIEGPVAIAPSAQAAPSETERPSFIERYSHMFEEDAAHDEPVPATDPTVEISDYQTSTPLADLAAADSHEDHEESIEQYMAKLMERVRGESSESRPVAMFVPSPRGTNPSTTSVRSVPLPQPVPADTGSAPISGQEPPRRKRGSGHPSNMAALRSLANDIARQAIGTYTARKYRRTALTQLIIAILAGMTSVYLMRKSPTWWDVQFSSACVALAASLYYAFLTVTTLIDSVRASIFEELESDLADEDPWHPPLPIDVERGEAS